MTGDESATDIAAMPTQSYIDIQMSTSSSNLVRLNETEGHKRSSKSIGTSPMEIQQLNAGKKLNIMLCDFRSWVPQQICVQTWYGYLVIWETASTSQD